MMLFSRIKGLCDMQIMLLDDRKITKLTLPDEIDGTYSMDYKPENLPTKKTINIEAQEGKWVFISNGEVNAIQDGFELGSIPLSTYGYFPVKIFNVTGDFLFFAMPRRENNCYKLNINLDAVTIGSDGSSVICYNHELVQPNHATITKIEGNWYITCPTDNPKAIAYLNDSRIVKEQLKMGDVIFIYGMKILWLNDFMYVYNPQGLVTITHLGLSAYIEESADNSKYAPTSDSESLIELYNADDYFFHILRIKSGIVDRDLEIDAPPNKEDMTTPPLIITMGGSIVMLASSFVTLLSILNGLKDPSKGLGDFIPQIILLAATIFGSFFMPRITETYQKNMLRLKEKKRQKEYKRYIQNKVEEIEAIRVEQHKVLRENNPVLKDVYAIALSSNSRIRWSREVKDDDFLNVRLGYGTIPAQINIKPANDTFSLEQDDLKDLHVAVANKEYNLEGAPIVFSLLKNRITALTCDRAFEQDYINGLILQLATFHSALDLKMVFLLTDPNINRWEYVKYMPHTLSANKDIRFFASDLKEIKEVCSYLEAEFNWRREVIGDSNEDYYRVFSPYYLIITNDYFAVKNNPVIEKILNSNNNLGYSFLILEQSLRRIPNQCNVFLQIMNPISYVLFKDAGNQIKFTAEFDPSLNVRSVAVSLSSIPLPPPSNAANLPTSLSFLDMFNVSKLEQLNISNRWRQNNPIVSLQTPIGVQTDGSPFYLDLHEKYHGPHGLVAGTTGSGKSEFLISWLLSLAINYHPEEVQYVIIDYKGGGLAGAFENRQTGAKVPHLVGTITNLDVSEMNRTLVSINSEIKRRQKVFSEVRDKLGEGTIDIYKYQKFYREKTVDEPMSHLMIVCDEFAELKMQQPDFMDELISIARIGRSLGIHLVLATQKPSGVVTDQIWSNSKFKICLKVQDTGDSMEMLKRPEAASLKEAGRFYLQVGNDEFFDIGQSGWSGATYNPTNKKIKKNDDSINFIDNTGYVYKSINDVVKEEQSATKKADQLTSTVKYIIDIAAKEGCQVTQLWRSAIPGEIFLNDLKSKYKYQRKPFGINPIIGEYDDPKAQYQGLLTLDITNRGNALIYGAADSGKENLLTTIIYSTCATYHPSEVNFYIVDLGAETLKIFADMPHVADVCTIDEEDKIQDLWNLINKEMVRRKQLFVDYNGNYINYCKSSGKLEPAMIIIINNYESIDENFQNWVDPLAVLFRDASKFGIYFIVTTSTENAMRTRTSETFTNKLCLQMPGEDIYRSILGSPRSLKPLNIVGRGLVALDEGQYEFQTAYICNPGEINDLVKKTIEAFKQYDYKAKRIPVLPPCVTLDYVETESSDLANVPLGINVETKEVSTYNFTKSKINVISTFDMEENVNFFHGFIKVLSKNQNINLRVIDVIDIINPAKLSTNIFKNQFDQIIKAINKEIETEESSPKQFVYVILGVGEFKNKLDEEGQGLFDNIFANIKSYKNTYFIFADYYESYGMIQTEGWFSSEVDKKSGIWLGYGVDEQYLIDFSNLSMEDREVKDSSIGFIGSRKARIIFKKMVLEMEEPNE